MYKNKWRGALQNTLLTVDKVRIRDGARFARVLAVALAAVLAAAPVRAAAVRAAVRRRGAALLLIGVCSARDELRERARDEALLPAPIAPDGAAALCRRRAPRTPTPPAQFRERMGVVRVCVWSCACRAHRYMHVRAQRMHART